MSNISLLIRNFHAANLEKVCCINNFGMFDGPNIEIDNTVYMNMYRNILINVRA